MSFITNNLLKHFIIDPNLDLFLDDIESIDAEIINRSIENDSCDNFVEFFSDKAFLDYYNKLGNTEIQRVIKSFAALQHYVKLQRESKKTLEDQLKLCCIFYESDMCKRNLKLKILVEKEKIKLEISTKNDIVDMCIHALNSLFKSQYPEISKIERSIRISEALYYLSIFKDESFMTLDLAEAYAKQNGFKSARKVIYWKLKAYVK